MNIPSVAKKSSDIPLLAKMVKVSGQVIRMEEVRHTSNMTEYHVNHGFLRLTVSTYPTYFLRTPPELRNIYLATVA